MLKSLVHPNIPVKPIISTSQYPSKKLIKQATDYSNLSQWIQAEIWDYIHQDSRIKNTSLLADRIIKRVLEDKNLVNNKIHKEGFDAGHKEGYKEGYKEGTLETIRYSLLNSFEGHSGKGEA